MKVCSYKAVQLNEFTAHQFTLFECKWLFSIIAYWFVGTGWQGRFHSHAFNAWSLLLWGNYRERTLRPPATQYLERNRNRKRLLFFPRDCFHELGISSGCLTVLFAGPWQRTWQGVKDGRVRTLSWGRKVQP